MEGETPKHQFIMSSMIIYKKLNDTEKRNCEGKITENECLKALKEMKNNKSPGSDGLTVEFYKMFWNTIKQYYVNSINYSYEKRSFNGAIKTRYN